MFYNNGESLMNAFAATGRRKCAVAQVRLISPGQVQ